MKYSYSKQQGKPGHCYAAQVFKDGKAFVMVEPTKNESEANETAKQICNFFNKIEK